MGEPSLGTPEPDRSLEDRLDSWKEIAAYLNRDVTTVQRWEKREGMPVHRHVHDKIGSVYASRAELDAWGRSRKLLAAQENGHDAPALNPPEPPTGPAPRRGPNRRIIAAVLAGGLAIALILTWSAIHRATRASSTDKQGRLVIAVVPLENLSGD